MGKETVRYPDPLVTRIEDYVTNSGHFESKSEFHRFTSEFFLTLLDPDHEPLVLGYDDILESLEADYGQPLTSGEDNTADNDPSFLHAYITVRKHLLRGDVDAARTYVTDTFDHTDREALLLDEFITRYPDERAERPPSPNRPADTAVAEENTSTAKDGPEGDTSDIDERRSLGDEGRPNEEHDQRTETDDVTVSSIE